MSSASPIPIPIAEVPAPLPYCFICNAQFQCHRQQEEEVSPDNSCHGQEEGGKRWSEQLISCFFKLFHSQPGQTQAHQEKKEINKEIWSNLLPEEQICIKCNSGLESIVETFKQIEILQQQIIKFRELIQQQLKQSYKENDQRLQNSAGETGFEYQLLISKRICLQQKIIGRTTLESAPASEADPQSFEHSLDLVQVKIDPDELAGYEDEGSFDVETLEEWEEFFRGDEFLVEKQKSGEARGPRRKLKPAPKKTQKYKDKEVGEQPIGIRKSPRLKKRPARKDTTDDESDKLEDLGNNFNYGPDFSDKEESNSESSSEEIEAQIVPNKSRNGSRSTRQIMFTSSPEKKQLRIVSASPPKLQSKEKNQATASNNRRNYPPKITISSNGTKSYCCGICSKPFKSREYANYHVNTHQPSLPFDCIYCDSSYSSRKELRRHQNRKHNSGNIMLLQLPSSSSTTSSALGFRKKVTCQLCSKTLPTQKSLANHMLSHSDSSMPIPKPFECRVCKNEPFSSTTNVTEVSFTSKEGLKEHMINIHGTNRRSAAKRHLSRRRPHASGTRDQGDQEFEPSAPLADQEFEPFPSDPLADPEPRQMYTCSQCPKVFCNSNSVKSHEERHKPITERQHRCTICPAAAFATKDDLKKHLKRHEPNYKRKPDRKVMCPYCGILVTRLKPHIRTHTGDKPFTCEICTKPFRTKAMLDIHTRIHTGDKPFQCLECPLKFKTKHALTRHLAVHSEKRDFVCEYCPKQFKFRSVLKEHLQLHTKEKPFKCFRCGARFVIDKELSEHKLIKHGPDAPKVQRDVEWRAIKGQRAGIGGGGQSELKESVNGSNATKTAASDNANTNTSTALETSAQPSSTTKTVIKRRLQKRKKSEQGINAADVKDSKFGDSEGSQKTEEKDKEVKVKVKITYENQREGSQEEHMQFVEAVLNHPDLN